MLTLITGWLKSKAGSGGRWKIETSKTDLSPRAREVGGWVVVALILAVGLYALSPPFGKDASVSKVTVSVVLAAAATFLALVCRKQFG